MTERAQAVPRKLEESERVLVTEWTFPPGGQTGWHKHGMDYVVVYRTPASLLIEHAQGETRLQLEAGHTYFRNAGVEHNVVNDSSNELVFVEIELK
jgi:beta-alanine degradation protein BauB